MGTGAVQMPGEPTSSGEGAVEGDTAVQFSEHTAKGAPTSSLREHCFYFSLFQLSLLWKNHLRPNITSTL